jgi:hypothetical protein
VIEVVDELREVRERAHGLDAAGLGAMAGEDLCAVTLEVRRARELLDRLEVHALGALAESGHTELTYGMHAAGWFAREAGLPTSVAKAQVNVARVLARHLPGTDQAWLDGTITREHVRVLAGAANQRIRTEISEIEDTLLGLVDRTTFRDWKQIVDAAVAAVDQDGPEPNDPTNTSASWSRSGAYAELRARFGGASVEVLEQIIEAKTDELFRNQRADRKNSTDIPDLTRNQLRGHAIAELLIQALGVDKASTKGPRTAVTLVVRTDRSAIGPAAYVAAGGPAATDILWSLSGPNGDHLLAEHFDALLCDCDVHELVVDAAGNPLNMGRTTRWATPKQRLAVLIRDGGCTMPGCDCPVGWLDIHHLIRWEDGGPTDIDNLVALCRRHHGIAHRKGWNLRWCDGWLLWTTPSGKTFWAQRHGTQRAGPAPPRHTMLV